MSRRRALIAGLAGVAVVGSVIAVSIVWPGLDAKRTPPVDTAVWALQTGEGSRYARVNTAIGELDTVRSVSNPTAVAEASSGSYLFSESFGKVTKIDDAMPADLDTDTLRTSPATPSGTVEATAAGDYVAYRTDSGAVFVGTLSGGDATQLDPFGTGASGDDAPEYTSEAIGLDPSGLLYSYSATDGQVLRYRIPTAEVVGTDDVEGGPATDDIDIVSAGSTWFLVDLANGRVWRRGGDAPVSVTVVGTVALSKSSDTGDAAYIADEVGLVRVPADGSAPERVVGDGAREYGSPARPETFDGHVYAAWLGTDSGTLWRSGTGETPLEFGDKTLGAERRPVFTSTGSAMILNETRSGWVWTAPDGRLVASSQDWSLDDRTDPASQPSDEQSKVVLDPKPPVAEPDSFGVRAGSLVALPVLLNDHDPNTDVLSIDPASVTGLDPGFGAVSITDNGQRLAVRVDPAASGTATFSYRVTDGTSEAGLYSPPTTVTLDVVGGGNTAPQWCGTTGCLATWPSPEVEPGGTVSVPVLNGWVDPEGDPILLLSVENKSGIGAVASTPSGDIVYQHSNASETDAQAISLEVTVSDTRGATSTKDLLIHVRSDPTLVAESFAVEDSLSAGGLTIDVAPHVTGTAGRLSLTGTRVLDDAPAEAVPSSGGTAFDFTAKQPGTYRVSYTVTAGGEPATAVVRITILADNASANLATAPVIAFVRPKEDATLDVFDAVTNPTRRVLLLSDVVSSVDAGATMTVDVVGQRYIRVTGTTATGAPGRLGTVRYAVSDGTDDAGSRVEGEATVYLLPSPPELAPIAVDDSVVVRAGAQLDIPVLDNDVAPSGGAITLNPAAVSSSAKGALAFAAGNVLRYLAPAEAGEYRIEYSIFSTGAPSLADTAVVRVTVIDDASNRAPRPPTLEGRVLGGQVTTIPFDQFGVDPDGDQVELDRIVTQPKVGSATISADGESIVYTSVPGDRGQHSFEYSVTDSSGATGTGIVRVGVLDEQSNPSPVTFTDYVQVQVGEKSSIRVSPLANDIDPTGGRLRLTEVQPDLPETLSDGSASPEYARQRNLIADQDDSTVVINAGLSPGTISFLYDVESESGNTARGLIVVKVVRDSVPDYPVVADTLLTAETRTQFPTGVDVVTGMVTWSGGEVDDLTLSLWGSPSGVSVAGRRISGALPEHTEIIPFSLTGTGTSGEKVTTYGFLRVPGDDDYTLALRTGVKPQEVTERQSVDIDLRSLVAVPSGERLEVGKDVAPSGARKGATCARTEGTTVRYAAGEGSPWSDACIVPVRLAGQDAWTYLSVPVRVIALDPQPELHAKSLTIAPGGSATVDLKTMTTWQGKTDWPGIVYQVDYAGAAFDVTANGDTVSITGHDAAAPGTEEVATVRVTSHPGVAPTRLILRVGSAPSALPQGGTVAKQCSQASGSSCTITVVGAVGEVNPLPGTPLELVDVAATGTCTGVTFTRGSASTVVATWKADAPGATCSASFSLRDAQGRRTNAERDGTLLLDLQGYPKAPTAITQSAYDDGSLTLRVDPGDARLAYPAITSFVVRWNGAVVATCQSDGTCPEISAPNGEARDYEAWAVNAVGESRGSVKTTAWAYDPPPAPSKVTVDPVVTGGEGELVSIRIEGIDTGETGYIEITSDTGETTQVRTGRTDTTVTVPRYRVGSNSATPIAVTPFSRFQIPPGFNGATSGSAVVVSGNGIGAPMNASLNLSSQSAGDGTSTVSADGSASLNGDGSSLRYGFARAGSECTVSDAGAAATFTGLPDGVEYSFVMCVESWRGGVSYGRSTVSGTVRAVQSTDAPKGYTFVVDARPYVEVSSRTAYWSIKAAPTSSEVPPRNNVAEFSGGPPTDVYDRNPGIRVRYRHQVWGTTTDWASVTPRAGSAPYQVWARWRVTSCVGGSDIQTVGTSSNDPQGRVAHFAFNNSALVFYDADGAVLAATPGSWAVPVGAVRVEGIGVTADWNAQGWGLNPATSTFSATCNPNLPPDDGAQP